MPNNIEIKLIIPFGYKTYLNPVGVILRNHALLVFTNQLLALINVSDIFNRLHKLLSLSSHSIAIHRKWRHATLRTWRHAAHILATKLASQPRIRKQSLNLRSDCHALFVGLIKMSTNRVNVNQGIG